MTTIINGITFEYLEIAQWEDPIGQNGFDGNKIFNRFKRHIISSDAMPMNEFIQLGPLEGQIVNLTTTDYTNRNQFRTYYGVNFQDLSWSHIGLNAETVRCEFLVLI